MIEVINNIFITLFGVSSFDIGFQGTKLITIDFGTLITYGLISLALVFIIYLGYFVIMSFLHKKE